MPTDKGLILWGDKDTGPIEVTDEEGNPIRIETMTGLTLDQVQGSDPCWEAFLTNFEATIVVDTNLGQFIRIAFKLGPRRQRKIALEKRNRRKHEQQGKRQARRKRIGRQAT